MAPERKQLACAIYTRKSSEEGLEQEFNSLDAQREACEAFVLSQRHEGWKVVSTHYDDGGFSGGNMERPALASLLEDIRARKVDVVVVYKVDRLTRALSDFAKIVEVFDAQGVSFVSVTQQFNTTSSMGRLTLNVLLSFAQFEREVTGERIRDKIAASKKKGMWMGGSIPLGYDLSGRILVPNEAEAQSVRTIFELYIEYRGVRRVQAEVLRRGIVSKLRTSESGRKSGGGPISKGHLYYILRNRIYLGEVAHKGQVHKGEHAAIIDPAIWTQVQEILAGNAPDRSDTKIPAHPSVLAGLLFDDRGNRLTPSHTQRGGARYRYYVCQALLQNQKEKAGAIQRVPAPEIEDLIDREIDKLLKRPTLLVQNLLGDVASADSRHAIATTAKTLVTDLSQRSARQRHAFTRSIISKVVVGGDQVEIIFNRRSLRTEFGLGQGSSSNAAAEPGCDERSETFSMRVPVRLTRSGRQKRIIISESHDDGAQTKINGGMIKAIARAFTWDQRIRDGLSIQQIADQEKIDHSYVTRGLPLAFLAPDIIDAILDGRQPQDLKVKRLFKSMPMEWAEQRRVFGFPTRA